ncbi:hypothetical protein VT84_31585 [Gemmata sp. SH-PL17]|uniref:TIGR03067 domain-containing protein n=1 Tax=Gemmata sp. SH-PL17 TaxID=1630693 RepID=UPI00078C8C39|nr:TIGR03067 domain-containing protein [Gemmata sp. SH-PL17]AMV28979.1 hypothetical protein VT84_31585 [Gemmata sp. SH-PL17]
MRTFAVFALFAVLIALGAGCKKTEPSSSATGGGASETNSNGPSPDNALSDKERFQGVWKAASADNGKGPKELSGDRVPRLQVEGDRLSLRESATDPGEPHVATWDSTKNPKTLTLNTIEPGGKPSARAAQVWIYKFEGDAIVVAFSDGTTPTEFKAQVPSQKPPAPMVTVLRFTKTTEKPVAQPVKPPQPTGSK